MKEDLVAETQSPQAGLLGQPMGLKRLAIAVLMLFVLGTAIIYSVQHYIRTNDYWKATVVGVADRTVKITFNVSDTNEIEMASYPAGMRIKTGNTVLVRVDENEGNSVLEVLED